MHIESRCDGYVTDVVLQVPSEVSGHCPSATTTNYAKEKLALHSRGWPITYLRSEFHGSNSVTQAYPHLGLSDHPLSSAAPALYTQDQEYWDYSQNSENMARGRYP